MTYPLSHGLRRASSPKGTPLRTTRKFPATAKSRPLGEGGLTRSGKTEGVFLDEPALTMWLYLNGMISTIIREFLLFT